MSGRYSRPDKRNGLAPRQPQTIDLLLAGYAIAQTVANNRHTRLDGVPVWMTAKAWLSPFAAR